MAPMRDLICGGCELAVCDISLPRCPTTGARTSAPAETPCFSRGNLPCPRGTTNPKKHRLIRICRDVWIVFQGLFCTEAISHCRKAESFGESAFASGETR